MHLGNIASLARQADAPAACAQPELTCKGGLQALTGDAGPMQPHYGTHAAGRLTNAVHQWFNSQLPAIEAADGSALATLRDNLRQLSSSAQGSLEVSIYSPTLTLHCIFWNQNFFFPKKLPHLQGGRA